MTNGALFHGITHIAFDLDGLLVDSERLWQQVEKKIIADSGLAWSEETTRKQVGMRLDEAAAVMVADYGLEIKAEALSQKILDGMLALIAVSDMPLMPYADEMVRGARAAGLIVGVASSSPPEYIAEMMKRCGWDEIMAVTVSGYHVERGKPAPDIYLRAAQLMGCEPGQCLALEDSVNGARAAYAAGLRSVAIPGEGFKHGEFDGFTHAVLPSLKDVLDLLHQ